MKFYSAFLFVIFVHFGLMAQTVLRGVVKNHQSKPLSFVSIYVIGEQTSTITNEKGVYHLEINDEKSKTIVYKMMGFKTVKKRISKVDTILNITMLPDVQILQQVDVVAGENPAIKIIKKAIKHKRQNVEKTQRYSANFYSKSIMRIDKMSEKVRMKINEKDVKREGLDTNGQGIVYLSETVSNIYKNNEQFKEYIIASKIAGDNQGFSWNRAENDAVNFYQNNILIFQTPVPSPISNYAFQHYRYRLDGIFYDKNGALINKIMVLAKRKQSPCFFGYIYIEEKTGAVFGSDLKVNLRNANHLFVDTVHINQDYRLDNDRWALMTQRTKIGFHIFGFRFNYKGLSTYTHYDFDRAFEPNFFNDTSVVFQKKSNKRDSMFWNESRTISLTDKQTDLYIASDSAWNYEHSPKYLDSLKRYENRFRVSNFIGQYEYDDYKTGDNIKISSPIVGLNFNTVQGWNASLLMLYNKKDTIKKTPKYGYSLKANYGFSDKKWRGEVKFHKKIKEHHLRFSLGEEILDINNTEPLPPSFNMFYSLLDNKNYTKFYNRQFVELHHRFELAKQIELSHTISYNRRASLTNKTTQSWRKKGNYTENITYDLNGNPRRFKPHNMLRYKAEMTLRFGSKYIVYPDKKTQIQSDKYPVLKLNYKGYFGEDRGGHLVGFKLHQKSLPNLFGDMQVALSSGVFLQNKNLDIIDYAHFRGNQIELYQGFESFYMLNYYEFATNEAYLTAFSEHDFKGKLIQKLPFLRFLKTPIHVRANVLFQPQITPYVEYAVGISKFLSVIRLDYVWSMYSVKNMQNQRQFKQGLIIGLDL